MSKKSSVENFKSSLFVINERVLGAFETAHEILREKGIPHVVAGGLAVNYYGYQYSTADVDFVVGNEILDPSVSKDIFVFAQGVPVRIRDVAIDYIDPDTVRNPEIEKILKETIEVARANPDKVVIVSLPVLIIMKLNANRPKDHSAIIGLLNAGKVNIPDIMTLLNEKAPNMLPTFRYLASEAERLSNKKR